MFNLIINQKTGYEYMTLQCGHVKKEKDKELKKFKEYQIFILNF